MIEKFLVANVKCGGCATAIQNGLGKLSGVARVSVSIDNGTVEVEGSALDVKNLTSILAELGYPVVDD